MTELNKTWAELTSKYTDDKELVGKLWKEIERAYTTSKRHYHNLSHLEYLTEKASLYKDDLNDLDTLLFSIFYHDIIYNITRADNEHKSAEISQARMVKLAVPAHQIAKCKDQIIAPKTTITVLTMTPTTL